MPSGVRALSGPALFAGAIALSSFLLFMLELMVGRLILPVFGGAPAAWATVLVFFQAVLLGGYLYGHLSVARLALRTQALLHVTVVGLALAALALAPARLADIHDPGLPPILDLLRVLALGVGLPTFLITSTTPLLSAWYHRLRGLSGHAAASSDPYWLYAASNGASFGVLVLYPLVIEPALGLTAQRGAWAAGFLALAFVLVTAALVMAVAARRRRAAADTAGAPPAPAVAPAGRAIGRGRRLRWLLLAAVPSGLLSAVTNLVSTDLVSAPLLWVVPLAIYLLTFVIVFSPRLRVTVPWAIAAAPAAATLLWVPTGSVGAWPIVPLLIVAFVGFLVLATAVHGTLAMDRPEAGNLTDFYLVMSAGGVLGGAFVGVLAPLVFPGIWEFPILLVGALAVLAFGSSGRKADGAAGPPSTSRGGLALRPFVAGAPARLAPYLVVSVVLVATVAPAGGQALEVALRWLGVGALLLLVGGPPRFFAMATGLVLVLITFVLPAPAVFQERSFFGVSRVVPSADGSKVELLHGTTVHGIQVTDPAMAGEPTAYYARSGPTGDLFAALRAGSTSGGSSVGIAGLGAGGLMAYEEPGDRFTFYEIDPVVVKVASDPRYFTFLSRAARPAAIVLGDARLTLAAVADGSHDLLLLDAFSSDSPPAHLMTVESLADAMRTVRPGGILSIHVSNRYYDLAGAVAGAARRVGWSTLRRQYQPTVEEIRTLHATASEWVAMARDPADLAVLAARGWLQVEPAEPLTDDRTDLLRLLRLGR